MEPNKLLREIKRELRAREKKEKLMKPVELLHFLVPPLLFMFLFPSVVRGVVFLLGVLFFLKWLEKKK